MMDRMAGYTPRPTPSFFHMDMRATGSACLLVPFAKNRIWPPAAGYSFVTWLHIDQVCAALLGFRVPPGCTSLLPHARDP